jgi:hypothetical protein
MNNATQATHPQVEGVTYTGAGRETKAKLSAAGQAMVVPGTDNRATVLAYYRANQPEGMTTSTGYVAGTPAMFRYLAWYVAHTGGSLLTEPKRKAGLPAYTNAGAGGHLFDEKGRIGRLAEHGRWVLRTALASIAKEAAQAGKDAGTQAQAG